MRKIIVVEGDRQVGLNELRARRERRPGAASLHPAPKPDATYRHPAAVTLRIATERLAESARTLVGLDPKDLEYKQIRDDFLDRAQDVGFAQAREAVRRVYKSGADRIIIGKAMEAANGIDDTEREAIKRILLTIGRRQKHSSSPARS